MSNWKLVDATTGHEIIVGDLRLTSRDGTEVRVTSLQPPHKPESSGKVYVQFIGGDTTAGYYPAVIGAKFIDADAPAPEPAPIKQWLQNALIATAGTQFGAIICSATGQDNAAPCFTSKAVITSDGFVQANFTGKDGRQHLGAFVGSVSDLARNTVGLAKHLNLNTEERAELFKIILDWIATDYSNGTIKQLLKVA